MASDDEPRNPFEFLLSDLARAMSAQGMDPHRIRSEFAQLALSGAEGLDPGLRGPLEELGQIVTRYLPESELGGAIVPEADHAVRAVHPRDLYEELSADWADYISLFERALGGPVLDPSTLGPGIDAATAGMVAALAAQAGPMVVNAQLGSVLGHFAMAQLARTELVLPRPSRSDATLAPLAIGRAAAELRAPVAEVGLWLALEDLLRGALIACPVVADRLDVELRLYLLDLRADAEAIGRRLLERGGLGGLEDLGGLAASGLFEADESPARAANLRELVTTHAFVVGVARAALEELRPRLFGRVSWIEQLADRREQEPAVVALANLFGLDLAEVNAAAERFAGQLLVREDRVRLVRAATESTEAFPSVDELADVGAWAARLEAGEPRTQQPGL